MNVAKSTNYKHRMGTISLNIVGTNGVPLKNKEVVVKQTKHKFLFGCSEFTAISYMNNEFEGETKEKIEERFR